MHHDSDRFRQIADPFSQKSRFWTLFPQWVCTLATTPPQTTNSPPPNGGNCIIRAATRRRYTASQLLMLQIPHHSQPQVRRIAYKTWHSTGWREKTRPTPPLQWHFREKTRPASAKTPNLGRFERAGRTISRSRPPSDQAGRRISRIRSNNTATLKTTSPLHPKNAPKRPFLTRKGDTGFS